ncbi:MAG: DUF1670 domain-containing protein [Caldilineae bacterium]|nr:MAG: DUF1670 domain-containing protein [Caldilineae bacterium]
MAFILHAHFLGEYRLQDEHHQDLQLPAGHHARLLLAYLLIHSTQVQQRSRLAATFWPDLPESDARRRLNQALWRARQCWDGFFSDRETIAIHPQASFWCDTVAFRRALQQAEQIGEQGRLTLLQQAVEMYRGPFLPGYYADWVLVEREYLRERYLACLETLLETKIRQGMYEEALIWAQQLLREEPLNEPINRQVMRLYALAGDRERALMQYETLRQLLAQEIGVPPSRETQELASQIMHGTTPRALHPPQTAPFLEPEAFMPLVGREDAWHTLQQAVTSLQSGRGTVVVISGEAGIGKSRLLAELASQARWLKLQLWQTGAYEGGRETPYGLWAVLLRSHLSALETHELALQMDPVWLAALTDLLPDLRKWLPDLPLLPKLSGDEGRHRLHRAISKVLLTLAQRGPLVVSIDDLQWADAESLQLLGELWSLVEQRPIMFVLAFREEDPAALRRITFHLAAIAPPPLQIRLGSLTREAAGRLIRSALGLSRPAPRFEARLYHATGGHPLFILETLRALYAQGILFRDAAGHWSTPWDESTENYRELPLSERVHELLLRRLAALTPAAQEILQYAALADRALKMDQYRRLTGQASQVVMAALRELEQSGLLREEDEAYRIGHDLIGEAVREVLSPEESRERHGRIAAMLAQDADTTPAELAHHYQLAEAWEEALTQHERAARQAQSISAFATALEHLDTCIQLADRLSLPEARRFDLLAARENILDTIGERQAQERDLTAMAAFCRHDPQRRGVYLCRWARYLANHSRYAEAEEAIAEALQLARERGDLRAEQSALLIWARVLNWSARLEESLQTLQRALEVSQQVGEPLLLAHTHRELTDTLVGLGRHNEALIHANQALAIYRELEEHRGETDCLNLQAVIATEQNDLSRAHELYRQELELCRAMGFLYGEARILLNVGNLYNLQGKPCQALQHYEEAVNTFRLIRSRRGEALARLNRASLRTGLFGVDNAVLEDIDFAYEYAAEVSDRITRAQSIGLLGLGHFVRGEWEEARRKLSEGSKILLAAGQHWMCTQDLIYLARVALELEQPDQAADYLEQRARLREELGVGEPDAIALALWSQVHRKKGDLGKALELSRQALDLSTNGHEWDYLIAFWHGEILQERGEAATAESFFVQAFDLLRAKLVDFPEELRELSLRRVPDHRRVAEAYERRMNSVVVRLVRRETPTGRPLSDDDFIPVRWTISHPDDERIRGKGPRRRHRLLRLLNEAAEQGAAARVIDLAQALGVSDKTIKRDLAVLRASGHAVETRGSR